MPTTTLFVCHEGQRTGAPLLLLWLIRWLVANTTIRPVVALMRDGPLRQEFEALCPTHLYERPTNERWHKRLLRRINASPPYDPDAWLSNLFNQVQPNCLYLNTLVLGHCIGALTIDKQRTRVVSSVHEMELGLLLSSNRLNVSRQIACSDLLICEGESVSDNIIANHGADPNLCLSLPAYVPYDSADEMLSLDCGDHTQTVIDRLDQMRSEGIYLFGFAGSAIDRKGFDLFPLLVKACTKIFPAGSFRAVWIGCSHDSVAYFKADRDLTILGVRDSALILPGVTCGVAALRRLNVMACLSREDPGPVVTLEAGAMGIPSVCFRECGGIAKLSERGMGVAVSYLDIEAFADALYHLYLDPAKRAKLGQAFQNYVFANCTVSVQAQIIAPLITGANLKR